uniref:Uncharacterized protein n=1 Tax=Globodera rostochiensis TaxID=31243 RepID=A0A914HIC2_GLORO
MSEPSEQAEEGQELFIEMAAGVFWSVFVKRGLLIVFLLCLFSLSSVLFRKIYLEGLLSGWKNWLKYNEILSAMNKQLEADYELALWEDTEFCRAYLKLYEAFRLFRSMADRDAAGASLVDNWRKAEEAEPLQEFFDADYVLHDRLIYAVRGVEGLSQVENNDDDDNAAGGEEEASNNEKEPTTSGSEGKK